MTKEDVATIIVKVFASEATIRFIKINEDCIYVKLNNKTFKVRNNNLMVEEVIDDIFLRSSIASDFVECKIQNK